MFFFNDPRSQVLRENPHLQLLVKPPAWVVLQPSVQAERKFVRDTIAYSTLAGREGSNAEVGGDTPGKARRG